jgi:hypothetical protein
MLRQAARKRLAFDEYFILVGLLIEFVFGRKGKTLIDDE